MNLKQLSAIVMLGCLVANPAFSKGITGGATEVTQLLNNAELGAILSKEVEGLVKQAEQIQIALSQLENLTTQAKRLMSFDFADALKPLMELREIVGTAEGLYQSLGDLDSVFRKQFSGFDGKPRNYKSWADYYNQQHKFVKETIFSTLKRADLDYKDMEDDAKTLQKLQEKAASTEGQLQAIQAGNELAAMIAKRLIALQGSITAQSNMMTTYMAAQKDKEALDDAYRESIRMRVYDGPIDGKKY